MYNTLHQIYGTAALEKTAADMLAEQVQNATGVDASNFDVDQLEAFAQQMLGEQQVDGAYAQQEVQGVDGVQGPQTAYTNMPAEQLVQTQAFQDGDAIGKVASYVMYNDLMPRLTVGMYEASKLAFDQVLKEAGFADKARGAFGKAKEMGGKAVSAVGNAGRRYGNLMAGGGEAGARPGNHISTLKGSYAGRGVAKADVTEGRKSMATRAGSLAGAAGLGTAGYYAAKEANFAPQYQQPQAPQQAQAPQLSALQQIGQQKALAYLQSQGYDINQFMGGQDQGIDQGMDQGQVDPQMAAKLASDAARGQVDSYTDELAMQMIRELGLDPNGSQDAGQVAAPQGV